jgi:hypothetical protein
LPGAFDPKPETRRPAARAGEFGALRVCEDHARSASAAVDAEQEAFEFRCRRCSHARKLTGGHGARQSAEWHRWRGANVRLCWRDPE